MWIHFDIVTEKVLKSFNFWDFSSQVRGDPVKVLGIGSVVLSFLSGANNNLAAVGRSLDAG